MEKYEEFGKFFNKSNIKIGASISFEDENNLLKEIQGAANAGVQHIEITSLARHGGSRSFGLSSSITSEIRRIAKLNGVTLGVHASPFLNICGFENNGFSMESRNQAIEEGKASIDFADAIKAIRSSIMPSPLLDIRLLGRHLTVPLGQESCRMQSAPLEQRFPSNLVRKSRS